MGLPAEKPLLPFLGKPLIDCKCRASAEKVSEFYVVTSRNTPETEKHIRTDEVLRTDANGYHDDLKQAVRMLV
jgi:GTP:adenosylcobinamide-phosphate guanylyltransferase